MAIARNTRIYGRKLGLTLDNIDYWSDVVSYDLSPAEADKDGLTFADFQSGVSDKWTLKITAIVSTDTESFWSKVWDSAGKEVPFILAPHGNKTAGPTKPHFTGRVNIKSRPGISSEAGDEKGATFEIEWDVKGEVKKVTATSTLGTGAMEDK